MSDKKPSKFKAVVADGGSKKLLMFSGVAVAGAIGFGLLMGGSDAEVMDSRLRNAPNTGGPSLNTDAPAPYQEALREADRQRIEEAKNAGKSAIPSLIGSSAEAQKPVDVDLKLEAPEIVRPSISTPKDIKPVEIPAPEKKDIPVIKRPQIVKPEAKSTTPTVVIPQTVSQQQSSQPQLVERPQPVVNERLYEAYASQMSALIAGMDKPAGVPSTSYFYTPPSRGNGSNASDGYPDLDFGTGSADASPAAPAAAVSAPPAADDLPVALPLPGKILYAQMITEANSDQPGPITARILQGDLAGSTLVGSFRAANNALILEFEGVSVEETADGKRVDAYVPLRAVAVNVEHVGSGVASEVDHHLFQRVAVTFATNFISGLGQAVAMSGAVTEETSEGSITRNPVLETEEQLMIATGSAASEASGTLQSVFGDRPTTVKVHAGTPIGILFLQR